jgi:hypothetical protein
MTRLAGAFRRGLICLFSMLFLSAAPAPAVWAQASNCSAKLDLYEGPAQTLQSVAHCVLEKPYPYLIGQDGKDIVMIRLQEIKRVERLPEEAKGEMIGLLLFEVENNSGSKRKLGLNGITFWAGQSAGSLVRIPFVKIKRITISCPQ